MVKHIQTIRWQIPEGLFECVCDNFMGLALKSLMPVMKHIFMFYFFSLLEIKVKLNQIIWSEAI